MNHSRIKILRNLLIKLIHSRNQGTAREHGPNLSAIDDVDQTSCRVYLKISRLN